MQPYVAECVKHHPFRGKLARIFEVTTLGFRTLASESRRVTNEWAVDAFVSVAPVPQTTRKFTLAVRSGSGWSSTYTMVFECVDTNERARLMAALRGDAHGVAGGGGRAASGGEVVGRLLQPPPLLTAPPGVRSGAPRWPHLITPPGAANYVPVMSPITRTKKPHVIEAEKAAAAAMAAAERANGGGGGQRSSGGGGGGGQRGAQQQQRSPPASGRAVPGSGGRGGAGRSARRHAAKGKAAAGGGPQATDFLFGAALGEGAYAFVARCKHRETGKEYACKIMSKDFIMRKGKIKDVLTEKNVLMKLSNPNVVRLWYAFRDEHHFYLVMDLCPYGTLLRAIQHHAEVALAEGRKGEACPIPIARHYLAEVADALAYLHSLRLAHRDLKPENILIDREGHLKLTDFATAKVIPLPAEDEELQRYGRRRSNTFCGTAEYVAPEVLRDSGGDDDEEDPFQQQQLEGGVGGGAVPAVATLSASTGSAERVPLGEAALARAAAASVGLGVDIWAYGCMTYQILCGFHPFQGATEYLTYQLILAHSPPLPVSSRRILDPHGDAVLLGNDDAAFDELSADRGSGSGSLSLDASELGGSDEITRSEDVSRSGSEEAAMHRSFEFRLCMDADARSLLDATLQSLPGMRLPAALLSHHPFFDALPGCAPGDSTERRSAVFAKLSSTKGPIPPPLEPARGSRLESLDGGGAEEIWSDEIGTAMAIAAVGRDSGPRSPDVRFFS